MRDIGGLFTEPLVRDTQRRYAIRLPSSPDLPLDGRWNVLPPSALLTRPPTTKKPTSSVMPGVSLVVVLDSVRLEPSAKR
jgi:hypothetical protein